MTNQNIIQVIKNITANFFNMDAYIRLSDGEYHIPTERFTRLYIRHNEEEYLVVETEYKSDHIEETIENFFKVVEESLKESKNFYKKMKKACEEYQKKGTPRSAYRVLMALGTVSVRKFRSSSGHIIFTDQFQVYSVKNPVNVLTNDNKREIKKINQQIQSLYKELEELKKRKEELLSA